MTKTTATVAAMVVMVAAGAVGHVDAAPRAERVVVVHVTDYAHVSPGTLANAEQLVTEVYSATGVEVVWINGMTAADQPAGSFEVNVVVLSREMADQRRQRDGVADSIFGTAVQAARRVYIFYNRIADHAAGTRTVVSLPLGLVLAHEIGHLLLPAYSHSRTGIMRAEWDGPIRLVPSFTNNQGATLRRRLVAVSGN